MGEEENTGNTPKNNDPPGTVNENTSQQEVIEQQATQQTNMEVHHHPDLHHRKKKFTEYFLEFIMIFLAVTMGFFAESLRENISRHEKEEQLMIMLVEDLKADIQKLDAAIQKNNLKIASLDTLRKLIYQSKEKILPDTLTKKMYYISRLYGSNTYPFVPTARTLNQFDRNDAFSFVRKQKISDSIVDYREYDEKINDQLKVFEDYYQRPAFEISQKVFNSEILESFLYRDSANAFLQSTGHFQLLTYNTETLLAYSAKLLASRGVLYIYVRQMQTQKQKAANLAAFIKKEYNLTGE